MQRSSLRLSAFASLRQIEQGAGALFSRCKQFSHLHNACEWQFIGFINIAYVDGVCCFKEPEDEAIPWHDKGAEIADWFAVGCEICAACQHSVMQGLDRLDTCMGQAGLCQIGADRGLLSGVWEFVR